jgi:hypothetical protein
LNRHHLIIFQKGQEDVYPEKQKLESQEREQEQGKKTQSLKRNNPSRPFLNAPTKTEKQKHTPSLMTPVPQTPANMHTPVGPSLTK